MKTKSVKIKTSNSRNWLRRILIMLSVVILVPIGLFTIGWLNRDAVIQRLQELYSENNSGTLTIGELNASFLDGFPNVGFTLKDIQQTNTDTITDLYSAAKIQEVKLNIGAGNLLSGNIKFEKISIKHAVITSEVNSKRSLEYHENLKRIDQQKQQNGFQLPEWLNAKGAEFLVEDLKYISKDSILDKYFNLDIHKIKGSFKGNSLNLTGTLYMDITVNNLGFNTKKGSFGNGARVTGKPKFTIDFKNDRIDIQEFPLQIDQQIFQLKANFEFSEVDSFAFQLQNSQTDFKAVKGLLTDSLANKVKNYDIQKPFKSNLYLNGKFEYDNDPDIMVEFSTDHNDVVIADKFNFKNASFSGYLTTDIYATDSLRNAKKSGKDVKIAFNHMAAGLDDIQLHLRNAYYQSTPEALNYVEGIIELEGSNEALANIIETDNFDFKGGRFKLEAAISGDIPNPYQFLNKATGSFSLTNTNIILKKNGLQLPIQVIDLTLDREHSTLNQLAINLPNDEQFVLMGRIENISGIISKKPQIPTTSQISIDSKSLNINEVISLAKRFLPQSDVDKDNRKTLHETLETVYNQFHPQFNVNLDSLEFNNVTIHDLKSNIDLVNAETILLHNFDFKYDGAITNLKGRVVVHEPESTLMDAVYIDAEATSSGPITVFKNLFDIQLFRIDAGDYVFNGNVTGNVREFEELLNNARGNLKLSNAKLYYAPAESDIIIDSLSLFVNHSDLLLDKFDLEVGELSPINLNGIIKQFPSFLLDKNTNSGSIDLTITAPYFDGDDLLSTIASLKNEDSIQRPKNRKALHQLFKDMNKFHPTISLAIDSLKYNDLISEDIKAQLNFENDSILNLDYLDLRYKSTLARIYGNLNAHTSEFNLSNENPFDLDFSVSVEGRSEDLNDYLRTTNFIFKSGDFEFNGNYKAKSEDLNILNSKSYGDLKISNTLVDFKAGDLQIPVDSLHIAIIDNVATLKTLDIDLPGKSSVDFEGSIDHFSDFINNSQDNTLHSSNFKIHSPYLDTADINEFLEDTKVKKDSTNTKSLNLQKFKEAMVKLNTSFFPLLTINIDTLKHKNVELVDVGLDLLFDAKGHLKLKDTKLDFYGGFITMNADVDLSNSQNLPVSINMQATNVDLHELVTRFDYFNDDDLRQAEKIEGILNYSINATGTLGNDGKLNTDTLNGTFEMELDSMELYNFKPIMDNSILMKDERFKNLRFRPIVQTFEIKNGELIIPRTEIQSSAIQVFVEGRIKFKEYVNVWLALPWKNLKNNDGQVLPEKTSYEAAGPKFYVQLLQDKTSEKAKKQKLKVKVRMGNRKLRKEN
ncbi:MAG: AsmA-like C-terminal region-containing protein [Aquaticitalea sp.]